MPNSNRQSSEMTPMPIYDSSEQSPSSRHVAFCLQKKWSLLIASVASFIACMVFASMYGFDYSTLSGNDNARSDWSSLREYSSFHEAKNVCGAKDEVANMTIWNAAVEKTGQLLDDMFTITVQAYRRDQLKYTLDHLTAYNTSSLYEIVVVWNDNKSPPPKDFVGNNYVPVRFRVSKQNSLNQKFLPDPGYMTQGILLCNDDWNFNHTDIDWAFHQWRRSGMSRLTGPFAGCWYNNEHDEAMYSLCSERPNKYHMALTALAFTHLSFLEYYWSNDSLMESLREYVDSKSNCEDIALNYVARQVKHTDI
ncbi:Exostosin-2 [Fusarium subglutinans]|uniref:Exostosin-2 n=1 Tax=Gibberella subglutinans TaxID=42677 RepID=A0A8H5QCY6_GIBSU|nr:Exostosin-2 [Fusarium subglutinans]KAF5611646.1 Exostosin-2 [Fusarium subglutinans]